MPPEFRSSPQGARELLALHGIVEKRPPVRSSDFRMLGSPFHYYLTRKLGLVPALRYSTALSHGSWFHSALELLLNPMSTETGAYGMYQSRVEKRFEELRGVCTTLAIGDQRMREIISVEDRDAQTAWAWALCVKDLPIEGSLAGGRSLQEFLADDQFVNVCQECTIRTEIQVDNRSAPVECVAQFDMLLFHKQQRSLWIVDYKTTSLSPRIRAASCPIEPQTQHYMHIVQSLLATGQLQKMMDLPDDTTVGGMLHAVIRKPTISFGQLDRDFTLDTTPFKSGPRKGEPRNEKVYIGEPRLENYIERCIRWYRGQEEYAHLVGERVTEPVINLSFTSGTALLDKSWGDQYRARLRAINHWRVAQCEPENYPWPTEVHSGGTMDTYAPFVLRPVSEWPDIVMQEGFVIVDRDASPPQETADAQ